MDLRAMPTERLLVVTARLLAASAVLVVAGLALVVRLSWQQTGQVYGPDGAPAASGVDLTTRTTLVVFETGYRPVALQTLLAAVLVAVSVGVLHRSTVPLRSRSVRWEVLAAGVVVLVAVVAVVLSHLFVLTADDSETARANGYIGPQSMTELLLANMATCAAGLALLAGASLWWLHLGQATDDDAEAEGDEDDADQDSEPVEEPRTSSAPRDDALDGSAVDYSRDWSPEDFRPPR